MGHVMSPVDSFADTARQFCAWAEGPPGDAASEAATARSFLCRLYLEALSLAEASSWDQREEWEPAGRTLPDWQDVFKRFGALPFNYYSCVAPHVVPNDQVVVGDLADDLADIWRDLRVGLWAYRAGKVVAAESEWRSSFNIHWGRHAADALLALHCWEPEAAK